MGVQARLVAQQASSKCDDFDSRRSAQRVAMDSHSVELRLGAIVMPFRLANLSATGAAGELDIVPDKGVIVEVRLRDDLSLPAVVRWVNGKSIGVAFTRPMCMNDLLRCHADITERPRRQAPRFHVEANATLHCDKGALPITLVNVSKHGLRAKLSIALAAGSLVAIDLPGFGTLDGVIRWQRTGLIGVWVEQPINVNGLLRKVKH